MADMPITTTDAMLAKPPLPWFVNVSPEYYDDSPDTGFSWEGWATDEDDAIVQALEDCWIINDRESETREDDVDPNRAKVHVAEIDFRRFAGPLLHWARSMGGWDTPLWRSMEAAVHAANVKVVPFTEIELGALGT